MNIYRIISYLKLFPKQLHSIKKAHDHPSTGDAGLLFAKIVCNLGFFFMIMKLLGTILFNNFNYVQ